MSCTSCVFRLLSCLSLYFYVLQRWEPQLLHGALTTQRSQFMERALGQEVVRKRSLPLLPCCMGHANEMYRLAQSKSLSKPLTLGATDTLKILLTTQEDNKAKRPHQAFLHVQDSKSSLETSFAFQVKETGKGKLELVSHILQRMGQVP